MALVTCRDSVKWSGAGAIVYHRQIFVLIRTTGLIVVHGGLRL